MLSVLIFVPLFGGFVLLLLPTHRERWLNSAAMFTATAALVLTIIVLFRFTQLQGVPPQLTQTTSWIPSIGANYALLLDGISLPLVLLTSFLSLLAIGYSTYSGDIRQGTSRKAYLFLFLLMETGLLGLFLAADTLLFYVFWEVALVPLYFIIGVWGHERRREAALKFFLYTRAGSLALLLSLLTIYLHTQPHSFSMAAMKTSGIAGATGILAALVLLGFVLGFGVKLPIIPIHSWLPDAHVEAPTAGSVMLAGVLLKMGGYGFIRIMLPSVRGTVIRFALPLVIIALVGVIYGAAVALAQKDFKRLVAFTSINHMGFVLLGVTIAALSISEADRTTALTGAVLQMMSHGLLTGGMFFLVGMLQHRTGTRELANFGGGWSKIPIYAGFLTVFAFGSFGLPTMSGFIAEFQVFVATLASFKWAALLLAFGVVISTALYLWTLQRILFGEPTEVTKEAHDLRRPDVVLLISLLIFIFAIGLFPKPWIQWIESGSRSVLGQ